MLVEVLIGIVTINYAAAIRCLECSDMPNPQECLKTTTCSSGQECYVEEFVSTGGLILFNSGCRSKTRCNASSLIGRRDVSHVNNSRADRRQTSDVIVCDQCCNSDFCNIQGCGKKALTQPTRGPICFNCPVEENPEKCRDLIECDQGEQCFLEINTAFQWPTTLYKSGCASEVQCRVLALFSSSGGGMVGRRASSSVNPCPRCCQDDFCNHSCRQNITVPAAGTQPTVQPTTKAIMKLSTKPTQLPTTNTVKPTTIQTQTPTTKPTTTHTHRPTTKPTPRTTHKPTIRHTTKPTPRTTHKPTTKPTPRTTHKPTTKPTPRTTHKPTTKPTPRTTHRPTTKPTTRHTHRHTTKPTTRHAHRHTTKPTPRTTHKHTTKPTLRTTHRPTTKPTPRTTHKPTTKPTPRTTYKPTTKPTPRTTQKPTKKPTPRTTHKPTTKPTPRTTQKPTTKPTPRTTYKLTTKPTHNRITKPTTIPTTKQTTMMTTSDPVLACRKDHYIYDPKTSLCLKFHTGPLLNWTDADAKCHSEGGLLAILTTQQKQEDIAQFLGSERSYRNVNFWVGANDKNSVHTFSWTNGQPLIINSNPNADLTDATCVLISHTTGSSAYSTGKCRDKHAFICERKKSLRP